MPDQVSIRKATAAELATVKGVSGEIGYDETNKRLVGFNGVDLGGFPAARYDEAVIKPAAGFAIGDLLYASSGTALARLADVATGNVLLSGGVNTAPVWGKISLTTHVTDALPIGNGGTGASDANSARANLSAAKIGANTDITSLQSGVTIATPAVGDTTTKIANMAALSRDIAAAAGAQLGVANYLSEIATAGSAAQRSARSNLAITKRVGYGDASVTIASDTKVAAVTTAFTAPRTWTLPAANGLNAGEGLWITDEIGGLSGTNTLTILAAGTDTINGAASKVFTTPYTGVVLESDGGGRWTYDIQNIVRGGTGATNAAAARINLGIDKITKPGDANYTMNGNDRVVAVTTALTTPRTWTLPAATAINPAGFVQITDVVAGVTSANPLTIQCAGSDTINGATSFVITSPNANFPIVGDGISKWTYEVQSVARGGTGSTNPLNARSSLGAMENDHPGIPATPYVGGSGSIWYPAAEGVANGATAVAASDILYLTPFLIRKSVTLTALGLTVITGQAGSQANIAVYANSAGRPNGAPVATTGAFATATSAAGASAVVAGGTITLNPGMYWFGSKHTTTGTLPTCATQSNTSFKLSSQIGRSSIPVSIAEGTGLNIASTFASAFPTFVGTETFAYTNTNGVPVVWYANN